jgi:hypothetical protein
MYTYGSNRGNNILISFILKQKSEHYTQLFIMVKQKSEYYTQFFIMVKQKSEYYAQFIAIK